MVFAFAPADSPVGLSVNSEHGGWGVAEYLLASVVDALHDANWQRGGGKGPKPERVQRPQKKDHSFGADPIAIADFNDWWDGA